MDEKPGDAVAMEVLASVETDKVTVEVRAEAAGVVTKLFAAAGDNILVGDNFIEIDVGAEGGAVSAAAPAPAAADAAPAAAPAAPLPPPPRRRRRPPRPPAPSTGARSLISFRLNAQAAAASAPAAAARRRAAAAPSAAAAAAMPASSPTPSTRSSCPRATAASR